MAINNPYAAYQQNSITTASPGELTLMLYNGCLKFIGQASKAIENKNIQEKNINIQKAQKIITELMITLNKDYEVSKNLEALYEYMNHRLIEANIKNDQTILKEVENFVVEFRDTWKQAVQINRQQQYGQGGQA
ncbi:flagellar export chaperone FliS [Metabacillus halosaccharovorans]|uniref:flagellar export chaperone FliS n=1 Tax=Metabacillus halosaccharovorans TaxID=930124 RepID=UPI001C1FBD73|nr:flagellar export chaperone FliS [Metabacillus halosaccharovorans]